jgi:hypothetical protein
MNAQLLFAAQVFGVIFFGFLFAGFYAAGISTEKAAKLMNPSYYQPSLQHSVLYLKAQYQRKAYVHYSLSVSAAGGALACLGHLVGAL